MPSLTLRRFCAAGPPRQSRNSGARQLDLARDERHADRDLLRRRRAVSGRTPGHDVGDVDLGPVEADGGEHPVEQLAGAAHERLADPILVGARCLADEHHPALRIAIGEGEVLGAEFQRAAIEAGSGSSSSACERGSLARLLAGKQGRILGRQGGRLAGEAGAQAGRRSRAGSLRLRRLRGTGQRGGVLRQNGRAGPRRGRCRRPPRHGSRGSLKCVAVERMVLHGPYVSRRGAWTTRHYFTACLAPASRLGQMDGSSFPMRTSEDLDSVNRQNNSPRRMFAPRSARMTFGEPASIAGSCPGE